MDGNCFTLLKAHKNKSVDSENHTKLPSKNNLKRIVSNMPPFSNDIDISCRSTATNEDFFDHKPFAPLHESVGTSRGVSFAPMAIIHDVMGLDDYTDDELDASWFRIEELLRMKETARSEAKLLEKGVLMKEKIRGIEHKTREGIMRKRLHRNGAYASIFCELDFQHDEDILDEQSIADAYAPYSKACLAEAQLMAERDALEAKYIYFETFSS